jgi:cytochrome c biogenesis protein CcdA
MGKDGIRMACGVEWDMLARTRAWIADLERRPVTRTNRLGVWFAIMSCPCHAGWLIAVGGGTAMGAALAAWGAWLYAVFSAAFVGSLWLLFRPDPSTCARRHD